MTQSVEQPVKQPVKVKNGRQGEGGGRPMVVLNKEQKELLEKFRQIENEKSNPSIKKFFEKAKNFWKN